MSSPRAVEGFHRSLAFLVAIDCYRRGVPTLRTPVADAEALARILRQDHGFEAEILSNEEASLDGIRALLADLRQRVGSDDRIVFYFAGHGIAVEDNDGPAGYILPQDADSKSTQQTGDAALAPDR